MSETKKKLAEYKRLTKQFGETLSSLSEDLEYIKTTRVKNKKNKLPIKVLESNLEKVQKMQLLMTDLSNINDKRNDILESLNEDEKREFKQLGLINDDEN
jgi:DNA repair ATPase RecN